MAAEHRPHCPRRAEGCTVITDHAEDREMMEFTGHVVGHRARRYGGFCYRVRVPGPLVYIRDIDPESAPIVEPSSIATEERLDYKVSIDRADDGGLDFVRVWALPNRYTIATHKALVAEFRALNGFVLRHQYLDEALRFAFDAPKDAP